MPVVQRDASWTPCRRKEGIWQLAGYRVPCLQGAYPMYLECVFLADPVADFSCLGSSIFSLFPEPAFAAFVSIRGGARSGASLVRPLDGR
ncbi:MAG: hypothetical protein WCL08_06095, partial [Verrucomicrobiota bacterium]